MIFLKLGGSLITDKTGVEVVRSNVLARLAAEIARARAAKPDLQLLLGHGSGSFGHVAAAKYGTRSGVQSAEQWHGFAEVSSAASRLSKIVTDALLAVDVPAISFQPSASAVCEDGRRACAGRGENERCWQRMAKRDDRPWKQRRAMCPSGR
jgi:isopentenyl phosphate kinase